jgi:hypothetical protein
VLRFSSKANGERSPPRAETRAVWGSIAEARGWALMVASEFERICREFVQFSSPGHFFA